LNFTLCTSAVASIYIYIYYIGSTVSVCVCYNIGNEASAIETNREKMCPVCVLARCDLSYTKYYILFKTRARGDVLIIYKSVYDTRVCGCDGCLQTGRTCRYIIYMYWRRVSMARFLLKLYFRRCFFFLGGGGYGGGGGHTIHVIIHYIIYVCLFKSLQLEFRAYNIIMYLINYSIAGMRYTVRPAHGNCGKGKFAIRTFPYHTHDYCALCICVRVYSII
jgi:hypothetical protein